MYSLFDIHLMLFARPISFLKQSAIHFTLFQIISSNVYWLDCVYQSISGFFSRIFETIFINRDVALCCHWSTHREFTFKFP